MVLIIIGLILSLGVNIALLIGIFNIIQDLERYEDYFNAVQASLKHTIGGMRSIDFRGAFEADDEVGQVFKGLLGLVNSLEEFVTKE